MSKELEQKIAALEAEKASLVEQNETLLGENKRVQTELENTQKTVDEVLPIITVNKKKYTVIARQFTHQGKLYRFEDLKKDKALQAELVKLGSGILKEI